MISSKGYAAQSAASPLAPFAFDRREPGPADVQIDILYCGVCHSDLHTARGEWGGTRYPCVPGHEIVGRVARVGGAPCQFDQLGIVTMDMQELAHLRRKRLQLALALRGLLTELDNL